MYYYMDHLHFHVVRAYAYAGSSHAQHHLGHKYLKGMKLPSLGTVLHSSYILNCIVFLGWKY